MEEDFCVAAVSEVAMSTDGEGDGCGAAAQKQAGRRRCTGSEFVHGTPLLSTVFYHNLHYLTPYL